MPREVTGYLISSGEFFESELEATLNETRLALDAELRQGKIDPDFVIPFVQQHPEVFIEFAKAVLAYKARPQKPYKTQPEYTPTNKDFLNAEEA